MKTVLVTGASSGIGKATAEKLLDRGYTVYAAARRIERMRDLEARGATALSLDVTVEADMVRMVDRIASMGGRIYMPLGSWYHATKHALEGWSDCLRLELEPFGVDVVVIEPGLITTEFGDVMIGPMLERSGEGPYAELAHAMAAASRESYQPDRSSPPSVIADVVVKALEARRPKTRYAAGRMAKLLIWARKWLGDRIFDRAVTSRM